MKLKSGILSLIAFTILASCSTSNNVVSNRSIQKRKYNDGFYVSFDKNLNKKTKEAKQKKSAVDNNDVTISTSEESIKLDYAPEKHFESMPFELAESPRFDENFSTILDEKSELANPLAVVKEEENVNTKFENFYPIKKIETKVRMIQQASGESGAMLILLVILCFVLPPLAVGIFEGITVRFWIDLILTIVGFGVGFWLLGGALAYVCALAAVIYALLIVLSVI